MLEKKLVQVILGGLATTQEAAEVLGVTWRSMARYVRRFQEAGPAGLYDGRRSNYRKIDAEAERQVVQVKLGGPYRSARLIRDLLRLPVHAGTVRRVLLKHHLERTSIPPSRRSSALRGRHPMSSDRSTSRGRSGFP